MKLLLNVESMAPPRTGIGNYTFHLLNELVQSSLLEHIECFSGSDFIDAGVSLGVARQPITEDNASAIALFSREIRLRLRHSTMAYRILAAVRKMQFRNGVSGRTGFVYHEPAFVLRPYAGPSVVTIHDLSFINYPESQPRGRVDYLLRELPKTLRQADKIITPSELIRQELIGQLSVPPDQVVATSLGASVDFQPRGDDQCRSVLSNLGLKYRSYLLFVGTIEPRKNVSLLLDAWMSMPVLLRQRFPLVIAGAAGWCSDILLRRLEAMAMTGGILYLSYVSEPELPFLYSGARAFIYPSIYEGFGLPVLEAMASGTPVICTENTAMAEFSLGVAAFCGTSDVDRLKDLLIELCEDADLASDMGRRGRDAATAFSWSRCASETMSVYASVL
ncbi:MAG: glycosyltransferase family 1 protein [Moraxellaceae bacterium]